jgi:Ca2+-binding EF-hand superfamily protein
MPTTKSRKDDSIVSNNHKSKTKKLFNKILHPFGTHKPAKQQGPLPPSNIVTTNTTTTTTTQQHSPLTGRSTVQPQQLFTKDSPHQTKTQKSASASNDHNIRLKTSWLSRTRWFTKMSNAAFAVVDADESGEVDEKELYSGLLLIHLKLGCYAGPAACRPVDRQRVRAVFQKMDVDHSGTLDRDEFREVMMVLCSNIFTRVLVQWSMTLMIVPLVAQYMLNALYLIHATFWNVVTDLDEYSPVMDNIELAIESARDAIASKLPRVLVATYHLIMKLLDKVPTSVWNTVPLTLLSCVLGCLAVPYMIFKIDDYFQEVAEKKKQHVVQS